ncbi:MAG TPA: Fe-S protein assembly co-chaperone HscB [Casimicrobiaceae bacterium]|nr:Fe-S protein assembly co-chaperone HscB [Casimicrobiaceae bacterium]
MIDFSQDHFALFGLMPRYRLDHGRLDAAYRRLQSEVHPDRHASAAEAERRLALQSSARVNEAYRALKNPVDRAQYLLSLNGIDALSETDTALPEEFLEHQLTRREAVSDAVDKGDSEALVRLHSEAQAEMRELDSVLESELDKAHELRAASTTVRKFKFLSKLAADIESAIADLEG